MMSQVSKRELLAEVRPRYCKAKRPARRRRQGKPKYDGRVIAALEQCWLVANGICGKRLVPVLAEYVEALERHGELVTGRRNAPLAVERQSGHG